ncbi:hypothetical protein TNCV_9141 [Trichonephila clavipes]|nr:hypothetical protein TNCV_9141 [Trichonephila clavipes]
MSESSDHMELSPTRNLTKFPPARNLWSITVAAYLQLFIYARPGMDGRSSRLRNSFMDMYISGKQCHDQGEKRRCKSKKNLAKNVNRKVRILSGSLSFRKRRPDRSPYLHQDPIETNNSFSDLEQDVEHPPSIETVTTEVVTPKIPHPIMLKIKNNFREQINASQKNSLIYSVSPLIQNIVPAEEWESFMKSLRENLPATFRITGFKGEAKALLNIFKGKYFQDLMKIKDESADSYKPFSLPWYPGELAWQMKLSRVAIRTSEGLRQLHNFLVSEKSTGNISWQETISMIPSLLLDVEPHHKVLDMCAASGSKTAQLVEFLHRGDGKVPDGLIVANDREIKRCYMLVHQAKRLNSPCLLITNNDAANFPNIKIKDGDKRVNLKFDRILCDVPCSGDGNLRKAAVIWKKWNAANGNNMHGRQRRILRRGLELLAPGGRMVYSTCSFNPLENEAVLATMLQETKGSVELLDVKSSLPGLKTLPGLYEWQVTNKELEAFTKFEEVPKKMLTPICSHMFPPPLEVAKELHLEHCIRILPHHQDTGGFFVAVLQKNEKLPWENSTDSGSTVSFLRENTSRRIMDPTKLSKNKMLLTGIGEAQVTTIGSFEHEFKIDDENYSLTWHVVPTDKLKFEAVIGSDLLEQASISFTKEGVKFNKYENHAQLMQISAENIQEELDLRHVENRQIKKELEKLIQDYKPEKQHLLTSQ